MWTSINKKIYLFLLILFAISFIAGIIFFINCGDAKDYVLSIAKENSSNMTVNHIINHLLILSFFIITSILVVCIPLYIAYFFYNGFLCGFICSLFVALSGFKGAIFSIIYLLFTNIVFVILLSYLTMILLRISINTLRKLLKKHKGSLIDINRPLYKKVIITFGIIFINDILVYFFFGNVLNIFNFLLN